MIWNNPDKWIVLQKVCLAPLYLPWNIFVSFLSMFPFLGFLIEVQWWPKDEMPAYETPAWHRWRRRNFGEVCEKRGREHRWNGAWSINRSLPPGGKYTVAEYLQYRGPALVKEAAFCLECGSHMPEEMRLSLLAERQA
jgi:hypothetical protein